VKSRYSFAVPPKYSRLVKGCSHEEIIAALRVALGTPKQSPAESMVSKLRDALHEYLRGRFPKNSELAEDAAQETVAILVTMGSLERIRDFDAYAERVAFNALLGLLRDERREFGHRDEFALRWAELGRRLGGAVPYRGRSAEDLAAMRRQLATALGSIRESKVAWWKIVEDLPEKEIERRTGLNHDKIQGIVRRVLARLRRLDNGH